MNKKWLLLLIPVILVLSFCIIFMIQRSYVEMYETGNINEKTAQELSKMKIEIQIGNTVKTAELENNASAEELIEILSAGELKMSASNYGGFEKVCTIGQSISRDDKQTTTKPGDIMLYNGSQLVIFYDSNSWAYTPIGHIDENADELEKFLSGNESEVIIRLVQ